MRPNNESPLFKTCYKYILAANGLEQRVFIICAPLVSNHNNVHFCKMSKRLILFWFGLLVFLGSALLMILEIVAGRIIATQRA